MEQQILKSDNMYINTTYKIRRKRSNTKTIKSKLSNKSKTVYGFNILFEETENEGFTYKTSDETIAK